MTDWFDRSSPRAPAPPEAIAEYERRMGTTIRPDYRAFLERWNGIDLRGWRDAGGRRTDDAFEEREDAARTAAQKAVAEATGVDAFFLDEVTAFRGIRTGNRWMDMPLPDADGGVGFYHVRLYPHGYVIGDSGSGDPYVQITKGERGGQIVTLEHDTWHFGTDVVLDLPGADEEDRENWPFASLEEATTDQLWNTMIEGGDLASYVAPDFATLLDAVIDVERRVIATLGL